jgi:DHA2 family multidrug resistance protein-like MFS transporter
VRLAPFAIGMMLGAANSHRMVRRFGTNKVVASGLLLVAATLGSLSFWGIDTSYWLILITIIMLSFGMANTMAPSTDAVMGAVPLAKAGVGSAMNDTTRMVGGALGVAIIGSILNSLYSADMTSVVANLPPGPAGAAHDSVGAAVNISANIGGPQGQALAVAARNGFVDAMGTAFIVAACVALFASIMVLKFMPPGHLGKQE